MYRDQFIITGSGCTLYIDSLYIWTVFSYQDSIVIMSMYCTGTLYLPLIIPHVGISRRLIKRQKGLTTSHLMHS